MRSGIVALVGRPNVGKSTLINQLVGSKVSITSSRPQTTRSVIRGVVNAPDGSWQMVLVDTPGMHKPKAELGSRLNRLVERALDDADVIAFVIDATQPIGPGDRLIAKRVAGAAAAGVLVLNKVDAASRSQIVTQLADAAEWDLAAYFPVSALTGDGLNDLVAELSSRLPDGPAYFPPDMVSDQSEAALVGEIIREKFLDRLREELPHSLHIAVKAIEAEDDLIRVTAHVLVERDSQKGIVIGKGGEMLGGAGSEARTELEKLLGSKVHLDLKVKVEPNWQRRPQILDRLGFRE